MHEFLSLLGLVNKKSRHYQTPSSHRNPTVITITLKLPHHTTHRLTYTHAHTHLHAHAHLHAHTHTYMHTYTNTHTHANAHKLWQVSFSVTLFSIKLTSSFLLHIRFFFEAQILYQSVILQVPLSVLIKVLPKCSIFFFFCFFIMVEVAAILSTLLSMTKKPIDYHFFYD